eukprot:2491744-Rhodomonas_salina.1
MGGVLSEDRSCTGPRMDRGRVLVFSLAGLRNPDFAILRGGEVAGAVEKRQLMTGARIIYFEWDRQISLKSS